MMMLELPNLDDKPYRVMMQEWVERIPLLTDCWTDFNPQDTGMMLMELLSALTEMQNYYLNQVDERHLSKYLELAMPIARMEAPHTDTAGAETLEQRLDRFAEYCGSTVVAATLEDYEILALQSGLHLDAVRARREEDVVELSVFRKEKPLSRQEMEALYRFIKVRTLLGTRLHINWAEESHILIHCILKLDPSLGRPETLAQRLRQELQKLFLDPLGDPPEQQEILALILSFPEVLEVVSFQTVGMNQLSPPPLSWIIEVQIDFDS